jgi:hypothetical protein
METFKKNDKKHIQTFLIMTREQSLLLTRFYKTYNKRYCQKLTKSEGYKLFIDTFKDNINDQIDNWEKEINDFLQIK